MGKYRENTAIVADKPVSYILRIQADDMFGVNIKCLRNATIIQDPFVIIGSEEPDRIAWGIEVVDFSI